MRLWCLNLWPSWMRGGVLFRNAFFFWRRLSIRKAMNDCRIRPLFSGRSAGVNHGPCRSHMLSGRAPTVVLIIEGSQNDFLAPFRFNPMHGHPILFIHCFPGWGGNQLGFSWMQLEDEPGSCHPRWNHPMQISSDSCITVKRWLSKRHYSQKNSSLRRLVFSNSRYSREKAR